MDTNCKLTTNSNKKDPAEMDFAEIIAELKEGYMNGSRKKRLVENLEFLHSYAYKEIDSLRTELRSANAKLSELKKKMTEPEVKSEDQEQVLQTGHIEMIYDCSMGERLLAYCEGMADAANHIMYYIETETAEDDS